MIITKTFEINIGDTIECLTEDGYEVGYITNISEHDVTCYMEYINEERTFAHDLIRK